MGFYQGLTLVFLVLLQWQIGFEYWRKVSQQYYIIHPFLQKSLNVPQNLPEKNFDSFFFFCKGVLSFQTLSLGVTTPHITPVLYRNWVSSLNFQALQPCSPSFQRSIARGLDQAWSCLWGVTASHITPVHPTLNCGKVPQLW